MAKFIFSLQNFLNLKEKLETQKKMEYGEAVQIMEREKLKLLKLHDDKHRNVLDIKALLNKEVDSQKIGEINSYIDILKIMIKKQEQVLEEAEKVVEKKRAELIELMKERKTLEILREKKLEEFIIEEKKKEFKQTDEVTSFKYNNKE